MEAFWPAISLIVYWSRLLCMNCECLGCNSYRYLHCLLVFMTMRMSWQDQNPHKETNIVFSSADRHVATLPNLIKPVTKWPVTKMLRTTQIILLILLSDSKAETSLAVPQHEIHIFRSQFTCRLSYPLSLSWSEAYKFVICDIQLLQLLMVCCKESQRYACFFFRD